MEGDWMGRRSRFRSPARVIVIAFVIANVAMLALPAPVSAAQIYPLHDVRPLVEHIAGLPM